MALAWKICWISSALLILQCVTSQLNEIKDLDMLIVKEIENAKADTQDEASEVELKDNRFGEFDRKWVLVTFAISLCFLVFPLCVYLFCPNCHIFGCKMVRIHRTHN